MSDCSQSTTMETPCGLFAKERSKKRVFLQRKNRGGRYLTMCFSLSKHQESGFTLFEVMISLAIIAGLLVTCIYTLNYHLGIADRHGVITVSTGLAKEKMYEIETNPSSGTGDFPEPYSAFSYETSVKDSLSFPGMSELAVIVRNGKEEFTLSELVRKVQ